MQITERGGRHSFFPGRLDQPDATIGEDFATIWSLRIDYFCTTAPYGHVISRVAVL